MKKLLRKIKSWLQQKRDSNLLDIIKRWAVILAIIIVVWHIFVPDSTRIDFLIDFIRAFSIVFISASVFSYAYTKFKFTDQHQIIYAAIILAMALLYGYVLNGYQNIYIPSVNVP